MLLYTDGIDPGRRDDEGAFYILAERVTSSDGLLQPRASPPSAHQA